ASLERHLLRHLHPALGIEGSRVYDGLWLPPGVELLEPPPDPAVPHLRLVAEAVLHRRGHTRTDPSHALHDLKRKSPDRHLSFGAHVVEHQDHAARGEAAQVPVAL